MQVHDKQVTTERHARKGWRRMLFGDRGCRFEEGGGHKVSAHRSTPLQPAVTLPRGAQADNLDGGTAGHVVEEGCAGLRLRRGSAGHPPCEEAPGMRPDLLFQLNNLAIRPPGGPRKVAVADGLWGMRLFPHCALAVVQTADLSDETPLGVVVEGDPSAPLRPAQRRLCRERLKGQLLFRGGRAVRLERGVQSKVQKAFLLLADRRGVQSQFEECRGARERASNRRCPRR
jgi:hypothetical protein|mmetsp:Transcript_39985/g.66581  ORF Transcript_39985/g.66581 Transcript_39985/m.66581 type:complete len:230 (-) Transcript_39985:108-797(-)